METLIVNLKMRFLPKRGVTLVVGVFVLTSLMSGVGCDKQVAQPTVTAPPSDVAKSPVEQSTFVPSGNVGFEIGDIAPDIEGPDLDGATFKLSDYRGKVVVLDFWGDW